MKTKSKWSVFFMSILFIGATRLFGAEVESCNLEKTAKAGQRYFTSHSRLDTFSRSQTRSQRATRQSH